MDSNDGTSVTLIFYRIGEKWYREPLLNIVAAAAQMSSLTHVEIAIGGTLLGVERVRAQQQQRHSAVRARRRGGRRQRHDEERVPRVQRRRRSGEHHAACRSP